MSNAIVAQGFEFEIGNANSPLTYTKVGEITSFTGFDGQASEIDVTYLTAIAKEFLMGLQDFGTLSLECNHLQADAGQVLMRSSKASGLVQDFKCTFSNDKTAIFKGYVLSNPLSGGVDGKVGGSFNIRITGSVVFSA